MRVSVIVPTHNEAQAIARVLADLPADLVTEVIVVDSNVGFLIAIRLRSGSPSLSSCAFVWPVAGSLLCAPVVYPWYLLWMLPFIRSLSTLPIIIWTVSIIPTYVVWHLRTLGRPWSVPGWVMLVEYGSVATAGAIILLCRLTRPAVARCSTDRVV